MSAAFNETTVATRSSAKVIRAKRALAQFVIARRLLAQFVIARRLLAQFVIARRLLAQFVIARRLLAQFVIARRLLAQFVIARRLLAQLVIARRLLASWQPRTIRTGNIVPGLPHRAARNTKPATRHPAWAAACQSLTLSAWILLACTTAGVCNETSKSQKHELATEIITASDGPAAISIFIDANTKLYADALLKHAKSPPPNAEARVMALLRPDITAAFPDVQAQAIRNLENGLTIKELREALAFTISPLGKKIVVLKLESLRSGYTQSANAPAAILRAIAAHKTELAALGVTF
jgi:hypothetical protein